MVITMVEWAYDKGSGIKASGQDSLVRSSNEDKEKSLSQEQEG